MRIEHAIRTAPVQRPATATRGTDSGFAAMIAAQADGATPDTAARAPDFTRMSRSDLFNWMNGEIRSGAMSLDESSPFLGMTLHMPVDGTATPAEDRETVDFIQLARDGIAGARFRHDDAARVRLESALAIMGRDPAAGINRAG